MSETSRIWTGVFRPEGVSQGQGREKLFIHTFDRDTITIDAWETLEEIGNDRGQTLVAMTPSEVTDLNEALGMMSSMILGPNQGDDEDDEDDFSDPQPIVAPAPKQPVRDAAGTRAEETIKTPHMRALAASTATLPIPHEWSRAQGGYACRVCGTPYTRETLKTACMGC